MDVPLNIGMEMASVGLFLVYQSTGEHVMGTKARGGEI